MAARARAWRAANPEKVRENSRRAIETQKPQRAAWNKAWLAKNKEHRRAYRKALYLKNKDRENAQSVAYKRANKERIAAYYEANKERIAAYQAARVKANPALYRFYRYNRIAAEKRAVPLWADPVEIQRRYDWAQLLTEEFGQPFEVDHVVPLTSKIVCGLHWHGNLQVLPMTENRSKSNRRWPDMPELGA